MLPARMPPSQHNLPHDLTVACVGSQAITVPPPSLLSDIPVLLRWNASRAPQRNARARRAALNCMRSLAVERSSDILPKVPP